MLARLLFAALVSVLPAVPVLADGLSLVRVASGLQSPVYAAAPPGENGRLFVLEQAGRIRIVDLATSTVLPTPFLDISSAIKPPSYDETGLLGLVFASDYATSGKFYVYYLANRPNPLLELRLSSFTAQGPPATSTIANPTENVIFRLKKQSLNHHGGTIAIRGDFLYLAVGDGGFDSTLAQNDASPFGKILRFDLRSPTPTPEVWAKGLRNPYRFSFDRETGDLYIGDVGEYALEEIDVEPAASTGGRNYGWPIEEGGTCSDAGNPLCGDVSLVRPVYEYPHTEDRCAVIGGYVYRGAAIPQLFGRYLFADYCSSRTWSLVWDGAGGVVSTPIEHSQDLDFGVGRLGLPTAIAEGGAGDLYFVDYADVYRLIPEPGSALLGAAAIACLAARCRFAGVRVAR